MDIKTFVYVLEKASPTMLFLYTAMIFLAAALVLSVVAYIVSCIVNKTTQMTGQIQVGVTLNLWPEDGDHGNTPKLDYGKYIINMQDPPEVKMGRLDPALNWMEKALPRQYSVAIMLRRFKSAFDLAGFFEDPSSDLLRLLLEDDIFCASLGRISRRSSKRGIAHQGFAASKKAGVDIVSIYLDLPGDAVAMFLKDASCTVENMCITLNYNQSVK